MFIGMDGIEQYLVGLWLIRNRREESDVRPANRRNREWEWQWPNGF